MAHTPTQGVGFNISCFALFVEVIVPSRLGANEVLNTQWAHEVNSILHVADKHSPFVFVIRGHTNCANNWSWHKQVGNTDTVTWHSR